jgi:hypothetical protein
VPVSENSGLEKKPMRRRRNDLTKFTVCKSYDRLRRKWQSLVDGTIAPSESQPLDEVAATSAQQKMVYHRDNCGACQKEDLALRQGEIPTPAFAEI